MNNETQKQVAKAKRRPHYLSLLDPSFKYVPAAATDVQQTWRRYGWTPVERKRDMPNEYSASTAKAD